MLEMGDRERRKYTC